MAEKVNKGSDLTNITDIKKGQKELQEALDNDGKIAVSHEEKENEGKFHIYISMDDMFDKFSISSEMIDDEGGKEEVPPKAILNALKLVVADMEEMNAMDRIGRALTESKVEVRTPAGPKQLRFPDFLAAKVVEFQEMQKMNNQVTPGGIIRPR